MALVADSNLTDLLAREIQAAIDHVLEREEGAEEALRAIGAWMRQPGHRRHPRR